ncbi:flagellar basal body-associated FliL family protein [Pelomonas sp. BJYL3]|uniref:flagellar basal body-associated FliL family protein n=1 Tax=Pelomonas sp. BJYL3 TaxID=2976697 RepID=UPI0022B5B577|nr:flagellar basal body-associated FliL family protein [Pelomonas sp. BJYL3]
MATPAGAEAAAAGGGGGGKKKLIIIIAAVLLLVIIGGGAALMLMKKKQHAEDEDGAEAPAAAETSHAKPKPGTPPTFVPLDPFTVNLADKEVDRFAQIGVTLEVGDPKTADQLKAYMPAIRSNVLMVLSHKTSAELLTREGKEKLAREILRESVRPMGIELDDEEDEDAAATSKKKKKKKKAVESPVTQVLFSTFIVQ